MTALHCLRPSGTGERNALPWCNLGHATNAELDTMRRGVIVSAAAGAVQLLDDASATNPGEPQDRGETKDVERLMALAYELAGDGREADAERAFLAVTQLTPTWSVPWYELGLICKYQRRWAESLEYNRRAAELDPNDESSWWNMAIAATALADWAAARRGWERCGISLPDGDGPPDTDYGLVPIRLEPDEHGEVVWARRIDPARAIIENVPLPTTQYSWRDMVLHDGAAEGYRILNGQEVPVFNVLDRLQPSGFVTYIVELGSSDRASIDALPELAEQLGGAAEDWSSLTRILCRECSLGTPHEHEGASGVPAHPHCGLAVRDPDHAQRILARWLDATPGADVVRWYPAHEGAQ